jgi:hypothetical protein
MSPAPNGAIPVFLWLSCYQIHPATKKIHFNVRPMLRILSVSEEKSKKLA